MANIIDYQLPSGGGLGAFDYTPMNKVGSVNTPTTIGQYVTILSVSGKGLLSKAFANFGVSGVACRLRITIDGSVVLFIEATNANVHGVGRTYDIEYIGSSLQVIGYPVGQSMAGNSCNFPSATLQTNGGSGGTAYIDMPIKFNSSLLIETCNNQSTSAVTVNYYIQYSLGS
jgi:hypothetical protein